MLTQAMFRTIYIATLQDCATSYQKKCRVKRSFYHDALCFSENDYFSRLFAERQNLQHQAQTLRSKVTDLSLIHTSYKHLIKRGRSY